MPMFAHFRVFGVFPGYNSILIQHSLTQTPTSSFDEAEPTKDPDIGGTDSANRDTATGM
jgi:hypothetical protein